MKTINRKELFEQVWSQPMIKLAQTYGISDVGLRKVCKRANIPLPPQGYWARKRRPAKRPPLPPHKNEVIEIQQTIKKEFSPAIQEEYEKAQERASWEKEKGKIRVPKRLRTPHHWVAKTEFGFKNAGVDQSGILIPQKDDCLNIAVGPKSLNRSLRILDALLKALDARGYKVIVTNEGNEYRRRSRSFVRVDGEKIEFYLKESLTRIENRERDYLRYTFKPSGKLSLTIDEWSDGVRKHWTDGKRQRIEECLNGFIISLVKVAATLKARNLELERQRRERLELQRIQIEKERLRRAEAERVKALEASAEAWIKSNDIRSYIQAVRELSLRKHGAISPELEQWIFWANQQADRLDPLVESPPSILDEEKYYNFAF